MLIQSLDRQKDETILSTFRSVSKNFSDIFKELVPGGKGELVMRSNADETSSNAASGIRWSVMSIP